MDEMSQLCQFVLSFFSPCKSSRLSTLFILFYKVILDCVFAQFGSFLKLFVNNFVG